MKKYLALFLVVILMSVNLCACGKQVEAKGTNAADAKQEGSGKKLDIVTTIFPEYDWVRNLVGGSDGANITMLLDNSIDLHSYQPTVNDIMKMGRLPRRLPTKRFYLATDSPSVIWSMIMCIPMTILKSILGSRYMASLIPMWKESICIARSETRSFYDNRLLMMEMTVFRI